MLFRWFKRSEPAPRIDDLLWAEALDSLQAARHLSPSARLRLRSLCEQFLREKTLTGAAGFEPSPQVCAVIALQACLPVLELGLGGYRDFVEIIIYPSQFKVHQRSTDDAGVVHENQAWLAGETMEGGPVVLSWEDVDEARHVGGTNVVIHEFVHKLDLQDGEADGVPPLPPRERASWEQTLLEAYDDFCDRLAAIEQSIPADVDPESEQADGWYQSLPLDAYAATDPSEFFAVSGEQFFLDPAALQQAYPAWYGLLSRYFRQDPSFR